MKSIKPILLLSFVACATLLSAQSRSFQALKNNFGDVDDVHSFALSGFLCRIAVNIAVAGEDDDILRKLVKDIRHVRFIVIPKAAFKSQSLTVAGFKHYLQRDGFDEMIAVREKSDRMNLYHRIDSHKNNRYFLLVEDLDEVIAFEMKGYIDPAIFEDEDNRITLMR